MKKTLQLILIFVFLLISKSQLLATSYSIVDTGQTNCYNNQGQIPCPKSDKPFYGQDSQYKGVQQSYKDNHDGTITDKRTGLMWIKARGKKVTWDNATYNASTSRIGGYSDWRMPTIKELYSLINFNGEYSPQGHSIPYINTFFFEFKYGDPHTGEREIDCQDWSATKYVATTMGGDQTIFGVNFADGRIKGYPKKHPRKGINKLYVRYVRGNNEYGKNKFTDNQNGTITDHATSLMWSKSDSKIGMNWESALQWAQKMNSQNFLGYKDWRLPNTKELQSIVDYSRAPKAEKWTHQGAAIDPVFDITKLFNQEYPFFWSSTTHLNGPKHMKGTSAIYIAFGRATGWIGKQNHTRSQPQMNAKDNDDMNGGEEYGKRKGKSGGKGQGGKQGSNQKMTNSNHQERTQPRTNKTLMDVHGAGAQRSDPKVGFPSRYPYGRGPQGDVIRINNYVRLVRTIK